MDYKNKFAWKHFDWMGDNNEKIQVNLGKFQNTGIELEYKKILNDRWSWNVSGTYQNPESYDEDDNQWTQESARTQISTGVDYNLSKFAVNLNCLYLADREDSAYKYNGSSAGKNPDHKLKDRVKINASFRYNADKNQSVILNMYNLLDRDEPVSQYEYYDLPFNWTLSYNYSF